MWVLGNYFFQFALVLSLNIVVCLSQKFDNIIQYKIQENQHVGLTVGKISQFIKGNSNPTWFLINAQNLRFVLSETNPLFELHPNTGIITIKSPIDLENLCPKYCIKDQGSVNLTVNIWSQKNLQGIAKVSIVIEDLNDNFPVFEKMSVELSVREMLYTPGKIIKLPKATDIDISQKNKEISYKLRENSDYFSLQIENNIQPILVVKKTMDSEEVSEFHLVLLAWNTHFPNINPTELKILIHVININDNEPIFERSLYLIPVHENTPVGSIVHKLTAHDQDVDSHLTYSSADPTSPITSIFKIELQGAIRLLRSLDYESQVFYYMSAKVTDGEFNAFSKLKFVVIDVNDEPPQFNVNPTNISVYENSPSQEVAQINIFDRDSEDINGKLKCYEPTYLRNKQIAKFIPHPANNLLYTVKVVQNLDRDFRGGDFQYSIFVCEDNGIPKALTSTLTLTINVLDRNDNYPLFSQSNLDIIVKENSPVDKPIYKLHASDKDKDFNGQIKYDVLQNTTDEDCCNINEISGELFSKTVLDREKRSHYQIVIIATDQSVSEERLSSSVTVNITVLDENDQIPKLLKPYNLSIFENQPYLTLIGILKAEDKDIGVNSELKFSLIADTHSTSFLLYRNGSLYSRKKFDREKKDRYCLQVLIEDMGVHFSNSIKSTICIHILDENDNDPIISLPEFEKIPVHYSSNISQYKSDEFIYRLNLSIHFPIRHPFGYIKVKDPDSGNNANISLQIFPEFIEDNLINLVSVDDEKFELFLSSFPTKTLRECSPHRIVATDQGQPSKKTEKKILLCFNNLPVEGSILSDKDRVLSISKANILIVIILAGTSAFLTALLVSAILCMIQPCKEFHRRRYAYSQNVIDSSNHNANESIMDNLLKSPDEFDEQILQKISRDNIDQNFNMKNKLQENWPLKLMACGDLNCQSVIIPQSSYIISTEEQRSDSGKGASDEDNVINSSLNINKLNQMNETFLMNSLTQSKHPGFSNPNDSNEVNLFANCGCEIFPRVASLNQQTLFPHIDENAVKSYSNLPMTSKNLVLRSSQNMSDLIMENSLYRSGHPENPSRTTRRETGSPVLSISDLSSHIDYLFFSQCCKKY